MKRNDFKKIVDLPKAELEVMLKEAQEKSRSMKFDLAAGKVKNVGALRALKRDIARILTVMQKAH